jgi:hypothetical protein
MMANYSFSLPFLHPGSSAIRCGDTVRTKFQGETLIGYQIVRDDKIVREWGEPTEPAARTGSENHHG